MGRISTERTEARVHRDVGKCVQVGHGGEGMLPRDTEAGIIQTLKHCGL
jgi:hypothetical protein